MLCCNSVLHVEIEMCEKPATIEACPTIFSKFNCPCILCTVLISELLGSEISP